jgi:GTP-binding protein HflX
VELASLSFQRSRLVRSWTHLERQRGGAGFLGGPGERQIELDRRQIDSKIKYIKIELERVIKTRLLHRSSRSKKPVPIVAFVGYTNAGKSTLFNRLTGANVLADDMLFATLDPTMRKIELPSGRQIVLSDTVGFVSNLPTHLVAAFRATLEEVIEADIIVHIRDISHSDTELQKYDVEQVLNYLGVYDTVKNSNIIEVFNKTDKLEPEEYQKYTNTISENEVLLSAINGDGCAPFYDKIDKLLGHAETIYNFQIKFNNGAAIAWLHENGIIREKSYDKSYCFIKALLSLKNVKRFGKNLEIYKLSLENNFFCNH